MVPIMLRVSSASLRSALLRKSAVRSYGVERGNPGQRAFERNQGRLSRLWATGPYSQRRRGGLGSRRLPELAGAS